MAKYTTVVRLEGYQELGEELNKKLKIFGVDKVSVNQTELTIVGKGHKQLWDLVELEGDESVDDFEGIDEESKKIGHTFPISKCNKILETAFGYPGDIIEIDENQVLYLRTDDISEEINDTISEQIEMAVEITSPDDDKDVVIETCFNAFKSICAAIGNTNLECEINNALIDLM